MGVYLSSLIVLILELVPKQSDEISELLVVIGSEELLVYEKAVANLLSLLLFACCCRKQDLYDLKYLFRENEVSPTYFSEVQQRKVFYASGANTMTYCILKYS